jgi:Fur family transcriptional regulator, ferric uptake regulator
MNQSEGILKKHKLRQTEIRINVINHLLEKGNAISQPELERIFSNQVDRVTLYRTLNSLEEKGVVHKIIDRDGLSRFALCAENCNEHRHNDEHLHFQCNQCSRLFCLSFPTSPKFELPKGFTIDRLRILADGVCRECG